jgi:hypothetical protein
MNSQEGFVDVEKQTYQLHRESEGLFVFNFFFIFSLVFTVQNLKSGQDTITPLTNTIFLKQLTKLKSLNASNVSLSKSKSNSNSSINSSKFALTPKLDRHQKPGHGIDSDASSSASLTNINNNPFAGLFSFRQQTSNSTIKGSIKTLLSQQHEANPHLSLNRIENSQHSMAKHNNEENESLLLQPSLCMAPSYTDQVYDAINNIIHSPQSDLLFFDKEFIENVKFIVKQAELKRKKKADKSILICRLLMLAFLIVISVFLLYFLKTLNAVTNKLMNSIVTTNTVVYDLSSNNSVSNTSTFSPFDTPNHYNRTV